MKFNNTFIRAILLIGLVGLFFSCTAEPFPELPAETHTGAGTFGCLVNNELVFATAQFNTVGLDVGASYDSNMDQLRISATCQFEQKVEFFINNPFNRQGNTFIDSICYSYLAPNSSGGKWTTAEAVQTGDIHFSRLDDNQSNSVVSGTFSFVLNEAEETPIHVTQGRFDLQFYSY